MKLARTVKSLPADCSEVIGVQIVKASRPTLPRMLHAAKLIDPLVALRETYDGNLYIYQILPPKGPRSKRMRIALYKEPRDRVEVFYNVRKRVRL